jgi:hypothetical protein
MLPAIRLYLIFACLFFALSSVRAEIIVESLQDKATYVNRVGFRVKLEEGFQFEARLDGRLVAPQFWQFATQGYHQFIVTKTHIESKEVETRSYRFVVQDAVRGNSEWGLRPWTPHPMVHSSEAEFQESKLELIYPKSIPKGIPFPIIAWIRGDGGQAQRVNGMIDLGMSDDEMTIRRGVGSTRIQLNPASSQISSTAAIAGLEADWSVEQEIDPDWVRVSGTISEDTVWEAHSRILVEGNLLILPNTTLTIEAGVVMAIAGGVDITVAGSLRVEGTPNDPTLITPLTENQPWGGFLLMNEPATANIAHTIITGSGAHRTWYFANRGHRSHRPEQAAFHFDSGTIGHFDHVYLIENAGQALHGENASITLEHSLVQKCQTVGQFNEGAVTVRSSAFIEFPVEDDQFVDGDNDAFYFTFGTHEISDSLIGWTKDDGIDAGGNDPGQVTVERCWIESCFHEGMALSGTDKIVSVKDSVFLNNGQGVEAGYLSPRVNVSDSLFTSNLVGLRFGDNYFRQHSGSLTASGTISVFNERDVWGLTANLWAEDLSKMTIEGNHFSSVSENFSNNSQWQSDSDQVLAIDRFRFRASAPVGIGFLDSSMVAPTEPSKLEIKLGLSVFSSQPISAQIEILADSEGTESLFELTESTVRLEPGQTITSLPVRILNAGLPIKTTTVRFRLSDPVNASISPSQQEFQLLFEGLTSQTTLVTTDSDWNYQKGVSEASIPSSAWRQQDFDDSNWSKGLAPFGYGKGVFGTEFNDMLGQYSSIFLRKPFYIDTLEDVATATLDSNYSGGFIVWINGSEVTRVNVPGKRNGLLSFDSLASEPIITPKTNILELQNEQLNYLHPGFNQIAVQLFNHSIDSPSLTYALALQTHGSLDLDFDGLPDQWESEVIDADPEDGLNSIIELLPDDDSDGDRFSNRDEYLANTDPLDPTSHLKILSLKGSDQNNLKLTFEQQPGRTYSVQEKDPTQTLWKSAHEAHAVTTPTITTVELPFEKQIKFYRLLSRY